MYPSKHPRIQLSHKDAGGLGWVSKGRVLQNEQALNMSITPQSELTPNTHLGPKS